jgi:hypothetical protein
MALALAGSRRARRLGHIAERTLFMRTWTLCLALAALAACNRPHTEAARSALNVPHPRTLPCAAPLPNGPIAARAAALKSAGHDLGCPVSAITPNVEVPTASFVQFRNGQITTSPAQGGNLLIAALQEGTAIFVDWGDSSPFHHFRWKVQWGTPNGTIAEVETAKDVSGNLSAGNYHIGDNGVDSSGKGDNDTPPWAGLYRIAVEGCEILDCTQGFTAPVFVDFSPYLIDLSTMPTAETPAQANATYLDRAWTMLFAAACLDDHPLVNLASDGEGFADSALARLEVGNRCPDKRDNIGIVNRALAAQTQTGKVGTHGDYDVALRGLMPILFRHDPNAPTPDPWHPGAMLPVLDAAVWDHVVSTLLTLQGPHDPSLEGQVIDVFDPAFEQVFIWETENHMLQMETSRFLTNILLTRQAVRHKAPVNPSWDNQANGLNGYLLTFLQSLLKFDFIEYNAKPYQEYAIPAIQNLFDFAPAGSAVQKGAELTLDYLAAKFAVESNRGRKYAPYRRRKEFKDRTALEDDHADAQTYRAYVQTGQLDRLADVFPAYHAHWQAGGQMLSASVTTYRIPDLILDLIMNKQHNHYFQRFYAGVNDGARFTSVQGWHVPGGVELYSSEAPFLISAGGIWMESGHGGDQLPFGDASPYGDVGWARATTLMPTQAFNDVSQMIRIEGAINDDHERMNTCVGPDFACGLNVVVPPGYNTLTTGPWTFVDATNLGFYATVYTAPCDSSECVTEASGGRQNFGFFEAAPSSISSFSAFVAGVLQRNPDNFSAGQINHYVTATGHAIDFTVVTSNNKYNWGILSIDGRAQPTDISQWPMWAGDIITSFGQHAGALVVHNPYYAASCILNFSDMQAPTKSCGDAVRPQILTPQDGASGSLGYGAAVAFQARNNGSVYGTNHPTRFDWYSSIEGYLGTGATIYPVFQTPGDHVITVVANDDGVSAQAAITYHVTNPGPHVYIASPAPNATIASGTTALLSGSASTPTTFALPCTQLRWTVDKDASWSFTGCQTTQTFSYSGAVTFTLTATDDFGAASSASVTVSFTAPPAEPTVTILQPAGSASWVNYGHYPISGSVYYPDGNFGSIEWTAYNAATGVEASIGNVLNFTWQPETAFVGAWHGELRLNAYDTRGNATVARVPINVYTIR